MNRRASAQFASNTHLSYNRTDVPDVNQQHQHSSGTNQSKSFLKQQSPNETIQFSRSSVGGSKYLVNAHSSVGDGATTDLIFESRFESGNLAKAIKVTPVYYELYLRPDLYTNKHTQWFYFRVTNTRKNLTYRLVRPSAERDAMT